MSSQDPPLEPPSRTTTIDSYLTSSQNATTDPGTPDCTSPPALVPTPSDHWNWNGSCPPQAAILHSPPSLESLKQRWLVQRQNSDLERKWDSGLRERLERLLDGKMELSLMCNTLQKPYRVIGALRLDEETTPKAEKMTKESNSKSRILKVEVSAASMAASAVKETITAEEDIAKRVLEELDEDIRDGTEFCVLDF